MDETRSDDVWGRAVDAAAEHLRSTHWDGDGCGTHGTSACSRCYGPSPANAREVSEEVLEAALPVLLADLADRIDSMRPETGSHVLMTARREALDDAYVNAAAYVRSFASEVSRG